MNQTFTVELDNMERILIQIELTVIAGDQESYRISARTNDKEILHVCSHNNSSNTWSEKEAIE